MFQRYVFKIQLSHHHEWAAKAFKPLTYDTYDTFYFSVIATADQISSFSILQVRISWQNLNELKLYFHIHLPAYLDFYVSKPQFLSLCSCHGDDQTLLKVLVLKNQRVMSQWLLLSFTYIYAHILHKGKYNFIFKIKFR